MNWGGKMNEKKDIETAKASYDIAMNILIMSLTVFHAREILISRCNSVAETCDFVLDLAQIITATTLLKEDLDWVMK